MEAGEVERVRESSGSSERTRCELQPMRCFISLSFFLNFFGPFLGPTKPT